MRAHVFGFLVFLAFSLLFLFSDKILPETWKMNPSQKGSSRVLLPPDYVTHTACEKMNLLWEKHVLPSRYKTLPRLDKADGLGMIKMGVLGKMNTKMDFVSDVVPENWDKPIHSKGALAKIRLEVAPETRYTGFYGQSSQCALMRLSLTNNPHQKQTFGGKERGVAPGIAIKFFINGQPSQDISLLTSLTGQEDNYNFFASPFSNVVAPGKKLDTKVVHYLFRTASKFPERLSVANLSEWTPQGERVSKPRFPTQIFLTSEYKMSSEEKGEDIREKFQKISANTTLFSVYGYTSPDPSKDYTKYSDKKRAELLKKADYIGKIVTTSEFVSSSFGDKVIFFKHRRFESNAEQKTPRP